MAAKCYLKLNSFVVAHVVASNLYTKVENLSKRKHLKQRETVTVKQQFHPRITYRRAKNSYRLPHRRVHSIYPRTAQLKGLRNHKIFRNQILHVFYCPTFFPSRLEGDRILGRVRDKSIKVPLGFCR